jgi:hypothetical protein
MYPIEAKGYKAWKAMASGQPWIVEDDRMPLIDEERSGRGEITGLDVAKSVVEEFVDARRARKG